jgi:hypothetical protein
LVDVPVELFVILIPELDPVAPVTSIECPTLFNNPLSTLVNMPNTLVVFVPSP